LPALQTAIEQTGHALAVLTGQPPAALALLVATPAPCPKPHSELALSLPAETLRQRPDVRAAEQQVLAAYGRVAQADAARYPSFRLGGSLGLNALTLGALSGSAALASTLLASVSAVGVGRRRRARPGAGPAGRDGAGPKPATAARC
jgi:multidrug efflux system outer membrane protein